MKKLFGTDGVRGKAGEFLSAMTAMRLAMAAGIYFREKSTTNKILLGKDTRRSGYMIENALVSGLTAVGYDVVQIINPIVFNPRFGINKFLLNSNLLLFSKIAP